MPTPEHGAEMFRCVDRWGRAIVLTEATWTLHIVPDRAPLAGNESAVRRALVAPQLVMRDRTRADRELFYRRGVLPPPYDHLYLKVVVAFLGPGEARIGGRVVTAFPTRRTRRRAEQRWL